MSETAARWAMSAAVAAAIGMAALVGAGPVQAAPSDGDRTPAVTSGGVFSDARDTALSVPAVSPAISADGVFSDARDTARHGR